MDSSSREGFLSPWAKKRSPPHVHGGLSGPFAHGGLEHHPPLLALFVHHGALRESSGKGPYAESTWSSNRRQGLAHLLEMSYHGVTCRMVVPPAVLGPGPIPSGARSLSCLDMIYPRGYAALVNREALPPSVKIGPCLVRGPIFHHLGRADPPRRTSLIAWRVFLRGRSYGVRLTG